MTFMFTYYPDYATTNPIDMIVWLHQLASFNEESIEANRIMMETDSYYN
jgi:hypothetical protein